MLAPIKHEEHISPFAIKSRSSLYLKDSLSSMPFL
jgi:hypothetical protein